VHQQLTHTSIFSVTVRLGEHRYGTDTDGAIVQDIPILQTFPHEEFNRSTAANDIAVIKLQQKVKFTGKSYHFVT
jgi:hypothetical protein